MSTDYTNVDNQDIHEFASFEGIEIAGTHDHGAESDFGEWLKGIDLHADVEKIEAHLNGQLADISGKDLNALKASDFKEMIAEAFNVNGLVLKDDGREYGSVGNQAPSSTTLTPNTKIEGPQ